MKKRENNFSSRKSKSLRFFESRLFSKLSILCTCTCWHKKYPQSIYQVILSLLLMVAQNCFPMEAVKTINLGKPLIKENTRTLPKMGDVNHALLDIRSNQPILRWKQAQQANMLQQSTAQFYNKTRTTTIIPLLPAFHPSLLSPFLPFYNYTNNYTRTEESRASDLKRKIKTCFPFFLYVS